MSNLIKPSHEKEIIALVNTIDELEADEIAKRFHEIIYKIYDDIPEKKRISCGKYSVIKEIGLFIYPHLKIKK